MSIQQTFLDKTMQGSVCSKVAVMGLPTNNGGKGGKKKNPQETDSAQGYMRVRRVKIKVFKKSLFDDVST